MAGTSDHTKGDSPESTLVDDDGAAPVAAPAAKSEPWSERTQTDLGLKPPTRDLNSTVPISLPPLEESETAVGIEAPGATFVDSETAPGPQPKVREGERITGSRAGRAERPVGKPLAPKLPTHAPQAPPLSEPSSLAPLEPFADVTAPKRGRTASQPEATASSLSVTPSERPRGAGQGEATASSLSVTPSERPRGTSGLVPVPALRGAHEPSATTDGRVGSALTRTAGPESTADDSGSVTPDAGKPAGGPDVTADETASASVAGPNAIADVQDVIGRHPPHVTADVTPSRGSVDVTPRQNFHLDSARGLPAQGQQGPTDSRGDREFRRGLMMLGAGGVAVLVLMVVWIFKLADVDAVDPGAAKAIPHANQTVAKPQAAAAAAPAAKTEPVADTHATSGTVRIITEPESNIIVDGKDLGPQPVLVTLPLGKQAVQLKNDKLGFKRTVFVDVEPKEQAVRFAFSMGWIEIDAPAGAKVTVDGKAASGTHVQAWEGAHKVEVTHTDKKHSHASQSADVRPGMTTSVHFEAPSIADE